MTDFIAASWSIYDPTDCERAAEFRRIILKDHQDWTVLADCSGFLAAERTCFSASHAIVLPLEAGVIVGALFDRAATEQGGALPAQILGTEWADPQLFCEALASRRWGAYVAILRGPGSALKIFRDPMGTLECVSWWSNGLLIVASTVPDWLLAEAPGDFAIDWDVVAGYLAAAPMVADRLALSGMLAIPPGVLVTIHQGGHALQPIWSPAQHCLPTLAPDPRRLARLVDAVTAAWSSLYDRVVAELSGGLDSAVVAAALTRAGDTSVMAWYNYYVEDVQGDERLFARAAAGRLGVPLTEVPRAWQALDGQAFNILGSGIRPGLSGMDAHYDRDLGERGTAMGAQAIFTGQGGDAVFFQMPTALVAAELRDRPRSAAETAAMLVDLARWTRQSVWALLALAWRGTRARMPARAPRPPFLVAKAQPAASPWLDGVDHLPPAKRLQIWGLANSRLFFGDCYRAQRVDVVHPLLSQPLVEHVLAIPVLDLTRGRRDRALAREAFATRLPDAVIARRGKGDLTAYYGRLAAASLDTLRPHLLDGVLVREGLIDRNMLDAMLDPERLIYEDWYAEILSAAIIESWARTWQARIEDLRQRA